MQDWDLFDEHGNRKYLTAVERKAFFESTAPALSHKAGRTKRTFAMMLYYTGCRITEGLNITYKNIDYSRQGVVLRTLKGRSDKKRYRFVPLPDGFLEKLDDVHHIKDMVKKHPNDNLWSFGRTTAWRAIKDIMSHADIEGAQATAHGFVIAHQQIKTPPQLIKQRCGWTSTEMLEVYGRALGAEERDWQGGFGSNQSPNCLHPAKFTHSPRGIPDFCHAFDFAIIIYFDSIYIMTIGRLIGWWNWTSLT